MEPVMKIRRKHHGGDGQATALPWRDPARFLAEREAAGEAEQKAQTRRAAAEQQRDRELRQLHDRQRREQQRRAAAAARAERQTARRARRAARQAAGPVPGSLRAPRAGALWAIAALVLASAGVSFAESYRGLFLWARHHGLGGGWAAIWPLQVDVFIAVGELALFIALADRWSLRSRLGAWAVTVCGLVVSVAGNVGHVASHVLTNRASAAVPPLAAAAALAVGLGVLKRVVQAHHDTSAGRGTDTPAGVPGPGPAPDAVPAPGRAGVPEARAVPAAGGLPVPGRAGVPALTHGQAEPPGEAGRGPGQVEGVPAGAGLVAEFAAELAAGQPPSIRTIRARLRIGQDRARQVQAALAAHLAGTPLHSGPIVSAVPAGPGDPANGAAVPEPVPGPRHARARGRPAGAGHVGQLAPVTPASPRPAPGEGSPMPTPF